MNLQTLLTQVEQQLNQAELAYGHGTTNAHDEAAWIVLWALSLPLDTPIDEPRWMQQPVLPAQLQRVQDLLQARIAQRKPVAYLTREAWLQGVPFYVDERSIVPRSLIAECIADGSIDPWLNERTQMVLDLCTGNGSLACLAAMAWPDVHVTGADLSQDALAVARINIERHKLSNRIELVQSDGLASCPGPWDLILCNPPYVNTDSMAQLPQEFKAEPALALAGGNDGMNFIRRLIRIVHQCLSDEGILVLEIGHERTHFEAAFPQLCPVWLSTSVGHGEVLLLTREALLINSQSADLPS